MKDWIRRTWLLLLLILVGLLMFGGGAQFGVLIFNLASVAAVFLIMDALYDRRSQWGIFPALDIDQAIKTACSSSNGASRVVLAFVILLCVILWLAVPSARADNLQVLSTTINQHWPNAPLRHIMAGQVQQESSWRERATLKTSRELGRGLVQLTIAYRPDGSERFNAYRDAVRSYRALSAWDWQRDPYNVAYQLTYLVLRDRGQFAVTRRSMADDAEAWRAALVCYNAGEGRWLSRIANAKVMGLDRTRWSGGLEHAHGKTEDRLLYGRKLWQAVNEYPVVIFRKASRYEGRV